MKLTYLKAYFLRIESEKFFRQVDNLEAAHGVAFLCPKCFVANKGPLGTHSIYCWFNLPAVGAEQKPGGRWNVDSLCTGLSDLTFVAPGATSVRVIGGCEAHFFIENGQVRDA